MKKRLLLPFALTFVPVCLLLAKSVVDYDHHADFSRYHTYSWIKVEAQDPLWNDRIKRDVDAELSAKGWQLVPEGGDTDVAAYGSTHNVQSMQTWYNGFGGGWGWRGFGNTGMATTTVQNTPMGRLMIDVFEGQSKKLLWRGYATSTLTGKPEKNEKKLKQATADLFKNFPPKSKG